MQLRSTWTAPSCLGIFGDKKVRNFHYNAYGKDAWINGVITFIYLTYAFSISPIFARLPRSTIRSACLLSTNNLLMNNLVFLATARSAPNGLLIRTRLMSTNAHVFSELACRKSGLEHFINLLKGAILDLGQVEVYPDCSKEARRSPDPACSNVSTW
jgi:hypothetical protein